MSDASGLSVRWSLERTGNSQQKRRQIVFERSFQMSTINARCLKLEFFTVKLF
jgi:hypothetical protein